MAFEPVDYYYLASWLYKQQTMHIEAQHRAVVSKAYYSAFLEARNKAKIFDKSYAVHAKTYNYYVTKNTTLANRLDECRLKRNQADYDTTLKITSRDSGRVLSLSKKILIDLGVTIA